MNTPPLPARLRSWANVQTATSTLLAGLVLAVVYIGMVAPWLKDHMGGEKLLDETEVVVIGGGASGADAYAKIRAGASLVQLYTAMVYEGPHVARRIAAGLALKLEKSGFSNIAEAVGTG